MPGIISLPPGTVNGPYRSVLAESAPALPGAGTGGDPTSRARPGTAAIPALAVGAGAERVGPA
jgi:hypothetical protein